MYMDISPDEQTIPNGVAADPRSQEEKNKDYPHEEMLGGSSVSQIDWKEKPESEWIKLGKREQDGSSSCGAQAGAKALTFFVEQVISALIYFQRKNFPKPGMWMQDIGDILVKIGSGLESLNPSQNLSEEEMNVIKEIAGNKYKIDSYYFLPIGPKLDMDLIAKALDKGHTIIVLTSFKNSEWRGVPAVNDNQEPLYGHFITIIPGNYTLYNGEKSVIIDDSTGNWSTLNDKGQRILTESWLKARCNGLMALVPKGENPKPVLEKFTFPIEYGTKSEEVKTLQDILKLEGVMKQSVPSTGLYKEITRQAVLKFQVKHNIASPKELARLNGKRVGPKTIAKLNQLIETVYTSLAG